MMPSRHSLFLLMFALAPLAAEQTDTVHTAATDLTSFSLLPLWIYPEGLTVPATPPDTLFLTVQQVPMAPRSRWVWSQRWLGLGMALFFSAVSYHYQREADATYQAYRTTGDIGELGALFRETQRLDRLAAWGYLGAEVGLALVTFSFIFGP